MNKQAKERKTMEKKMYCPECGHEFKQGESEFNYETGNTDYACPKCKWEGTDPLDYDKIKEDLEERLGEGRTVTDDDVENLVRATEYCEEYNEAIDMVAREIEKSAGEDDDEDEYEDDEPSAVMVIEVRRTDYSVDQVLSNHNCMTVGELKQMLNEYDNDDLTPIVFSHDNGYTYGPLQKGSIDFREM